MVQRRSVGAAAVRRRAAIGGREANARAHDAAR